MTSSLRSHLFIKEFYHPGSAAEEVSGELRHNAPTSLFDCEVQNLPVTLRTCDFAVLLLHSRFMVLDGNLLFERSTNFLLVNSLTSVCILQKVVDESDGDKQGAEWARKQRELEEKLKQVQLKEEAERKKRLVREQHRLLVSVFTNSSRVFTFKNFEKFVRVPFPSGKRAGNGGQDVRATETHREGSG